MSRTTNTPQRRKPNGPTWIDTTRQLSEIFFKYWKWPFILGAILYNIDKIPADYVVPAILSIGGVSAVKGIIEAIKSQKQ